MSTLVYVLSALRRAAENAYAWSVTPNEAGALVTEIEALRAEVAELRAREEWLMCAVETTDVARCDDRVAVVAFLHACGHDAAAEAVAKVGHPLHALLPLVNADAIRNGGGNP